MRRRRAEEAPVAGAGAGLSEACSVFVQALADGDRAATVRARQVAVTGARTAGVVARSWNSGPAYPLMTPTVTVDEVLPADQAARWLARVAPPAASSLG
ncbi:MAG: hypothetical protein P8Z68_11965 [Kineosporiaceae bacterium]